MNAENIQCPALIVHGLNDYNVRTKEFDLMYQAYEQAGIPAKILLHQDGHLTPTYPSGGLSFLIGEESYDAILNQWFSHYLYGLDNGVEDMAAVTAQSNTNTMEQLRQLEGRERHHPHRGRRRRGERLHQQRLRRHRRGP